jgi:ubiquinone/menaquinone biosynthesis C-methylase UbiE
MNADPIARVYRWLEYAAFGLALQRRRMAFLSDLGDTRRALVLGDGDGRFLAQFLKHNRRVQVDCVDLSSRMLDLARKRAGSERVTYHQADALQFSLPDRNYDLIVTHFFLDCFDQAGAARLVERVSPSACPRGRWLISEFRRTWWSPPLLAALYFFFRITTGLPTTRLVDHRPLLKRHGFQLVREERAWFGLLTSELWSRRG